MESNINELPSGLQQAQGAKATIRLGKVVINNMPVLPYAVDEAMNRLSLNLGFVGKEIERIMVISSVPDEGKSFISMMLWKKLSESGQNSVLVDCDLRKSVMVSKYQIIRSDNRTIGGLSNYLSGNCGIEDTLFHTNIRHGSIVPNQKNAPRPALLLQNDRMEKLLTFLAAKYDRVIVDVPPLGPVSDGEIIGSLCDGFLLVVRAGMTNKRLVRNSLVRMERSGCTFLGFVLSRAGTSRGSYYGGLYGKYGGYNYSSYEYE